MNTIFVAIEYIDKHAGYYFYVWRRFQCVDDKYTMLQFGDIDPQYLNLASTEHTVTEEDFDEYSALWYQTDVEYIGLNQGRRTGRFFVQPEYS